MFVLLILRLIQYNPVNVDIMKTMKPRGFDIARIIIDRKIRMNFDNFV